MSDVVNVGLRPALVPDTSPKLGYNRPDWNPVWEAACETGVPLSFHVGFGTNPVRNRNPGGAIANYVTVASNIIGTVAQLCASGVLETFPELRCVMTESNAGWLAWVMFQMDEAWKKHAHWAKPKLEIPPSEYCRRQIQAYADNGVTTLALWLMAFGVDGRQAARALAPSAT